MSIQPTTPRLCSVFLEEPQEIANSFNCKGYLYKTAAIVCAVALVAIFTGFMAIYLGALADLPGWGVALALVAAMGAMKGLDLWSAGSGQFAKAVEYQAYADKYQEISGWNQQNRHDFYVQEGIIQQNAVARVNGGAIEALREKSPSDLFSALQPAIARYMVLAEKTVKLTQRIQENTRMIAENHANGNDELELKHAFVVLQLEEDLAFNLLRQAILLENLYDPIGEYTFQENERGIALINRAGESVGQMKRKEPLIRALDFIAQRDREFFVPEGKPPLLLDATLAKRPIEIQEIIFEAL